MATTRKAAQWVPRHSTWPLAKWNDFVNGYRRPAALRGGLADGAHPNDLYFVPLRGELLRGIAVEREHTHDPVVALSIAMDHLVEDPRYYAALDEMERELEQSRVRSLEQVRKRRRRA